MISLTAILVAASGIPIGFSIYQFYFFLRWNSPFTREGLLSPIIPGRKSDMEHSDKGYKQGNIIPFYFMEEGMDK